MIGIYCITNKINNKKYIGQSIQIEIRLSQHFTNALNPKDHGYDTKFYRAIRKYGKENFDIEILEECNKEELNKKEKYWIEYYDSFLHGYNSNKGGENVTENNELHPMAKLTNQDVLNIKNLLKNSSISQYSLAEKYNITQSEISMINSGKKWRNLGNYSYPIRTPKEIGKNKTGADNPVAIFTEEDVNNARKRYVTETARKIFEDYKEKCSYTSFERMILGKTYTNLPIYKKKEKKWINI